MVSLLYGFVIMIMVTSSGVINCMEGTKSPPVLFARTKEAIDQYCTSDQTVLIIGNHNGVEVLSRYCYGKSFNKLGIIDINKDDVLKQIESKKFVIQFDVIICDSLFRCEGEENIIQKINTLLKPNGTLIVRTREYMSSGKKLSEIVLPSSSSSSFTIKENRLINFGDQKKARMLVASKEASTHK